MRKLGLRDVFAWSAILEKLDVAKGITKIQQEAVEQPDPQQYAGVQLMALVFTRLYKAETELVDWLVDFLGKDKEEVESLSFIEIKNILSDLSKSEEFTELFTSLVTTEAN